MSKLDRLLAEAAAALRTGRPQHARRRLQAVLRNHPGHPDALHGLALAAHAEGRNDEALVWLDRLLSLRPQDAGVRLHRAEILRALGRFAEAVEDYRFTLAASPHQVDASFGMGVALLALDRPEEAVPILRRTATAAPEDADVRLNLARALAWSGAVGAAAEEYARALVQRPDDAQAWLEQAQALRADGRLPEAAIAYRNAVGLTPTDLEAHLGLADCLGNTGDGHAAVEACRTAVSLAPQSAVAHLQLGIWLQTLGSFAEAEAAHRRAIALEPTLAPAHYNLSLLGCELDTDLLGDLAENRQMPTEDRIRAHFALARHYDRSGEADVAFRHADAGNALRRPARPFDAEGHQGLVERLIALLDRDFWTARRDLGEGDERPVLIVGMPRSGTTLVEQILACHPQVHGGGERDELRILVQSLPGRLRGGTYPELLADIDRDQSQAMADVYLHPLRGLGPDVLRATDKMPGNYLRLGLAALLLPGARIVECRRNALDTCLSCFFQDFVQGQGFTYDLRALGRVYSGYRQLMDHWSRILPLPVHTLRYESLVSDPEPTIRALLDFCGLPWDPRCLDHHRHDRQIRTASHWQVRQPLYRQSMGRSRRYAHHLAPLIEALGPWTEE